MPAITPILIPIVLPGLFWWAMTTSLVAQDNSTEVNGSTNRRQSPAQKIDSEMERYMLAIGASAATVAISHKGKIVYSRGYGFSDNRGRVPTTPRTTMRLASCSKPFTAATIHALIDRGDISLETRAYEYLGIRPWTNLADERIKRITVGQLLKHRGGWDRDATFDPMYQLSDIKDSLEIRRMQKQHIVRYMWDRPLQHDPGSEEHYSNFGYLLLGLVIEKATGKSCVESIRDLVGEPIGAADEISISSVNKQNRKSREVDYANENRLDLHLRDSASGLATNAETVCRFMEYFWIDGKRKTGKRNQYLFQIGSHPFTTTTLMEQRLDGFNYAIMLNSRRNETYEEDNEVIRDNFNLVLDSVAADLIQDQP